MRYDGRVKGKVKEVKVKVKVKGKRWGKRRDKYIPCNIQHRSTDAKITLPPS